MADIKLQIVNAALTAAGEDPMDASLTPGSVMANAALSNYDDIVSEEIENGTWKFATKEAAPSLLSATLDCPLKYQWQLPADVLAIQAVLYKGRVIEDGESFDIQGSVIRTPVNTDIKVRYSFRPDEATWPQRFRRIIVGRLEALFLRTTERHNEAEGRDEATDKKSLVAKHTEARQRPNRPVGAGSVALARVGCGRRRRW